MAPPAYRNTNIARKQLKRKRSSAGTDEHDGCPLHDEVLLLVMSRTSPTSSGAPSRLLRGRPPSSATALCLPPPPPIAASAASRSASSSCPPAPAPSRRRIIIITICRYASCHCATPPPPCDARRSRGRRRFAHLAGLLLPRGGVPQRPPRHGDPPDQEPYPEAVRVQPHHRRGRRPPAPALKLALLRLAKAGVRGVYRTEGSLLGSLPDGRRCRGTRRGYASSSPTTTT
ncbi:hypothetical protein OsI_03960 [Oryza sativa Indica Group]|uniref:Uncharacterized protein n=1 Tax=Oryza sativa subsp. indica TaxID=39946 RepID=B8AAE1_ORYSI|nr:hypothetical protein OsI_03960 [Oryza sativa Indica Group]